jgi:hypothetical protein
MSDYIYKMAGVQLIFFFDWLVRGLNYGSWPVTLSLLEDTGLYSAQRPEPVWRLRNF